MRHLEGKVAGYYFVFTDIDGRGKKWRLALERAGFLFFPVEDFYEATDVFEKAPRFAFSPPAEPTREAPFDECYSCQAAAREESVETRTRNLGFMGTRSRVVFECGSVVHHDENGNAVIERPCPRKKGGGS